MASEPRRFPIQHVFHPETLAHRDRVIDDGGMIPDLYMLNQVVDILKMIGLDRIVFGYDAEIFGYKAGVGPGIQKLYSITGFEMDLIQNVIVNQPFLLKKSPVVQRNLIETDGEGMHMKTEAAPISGPLTIYSAFQLIDSTVQAGIYGGHRSEDPALVVNANGMLCQLANEELNHLAASERMTLYIHRFEADNYSARKSSSPIMLKSHTVVPEWLGFSLFSNGENPASSQISLGTLIATRESSAEEQLGIIRQIFNICYGHHIN